MLAIVMVLDAESTVQVGVLPFREQGIVVAPLVKGSTSAGYSTSIYPPIGIENVFQKLKVNVTGWLASWFSLST